MLATSVAQCDANAESVATAWGERFIRCETRRGLRSFTDREGVTRRYCAAISHRYNVERRFGKKVGEVCWVCGKPTDELAISVRLLDQIGLECSYCQDQFDG